MQELKGPTNERRGKQYTMSDRGSINSLTEKIEESVYQPLSPTKNGKTKRQGTEKYPEH